MNLYEDMVAARAVSNTVQNGRKSETYSQYNMQTWVFQIALFKGFLNIPHTPLPPEHSVDTNEAMMAPPRKHTKLAQTVHTPRDMELTRMAVRPPLINQA